MPWWGWTLAGLAYAISFRLSLRWWVEEFDFGDFDWSDFFFAIWLAALTTIPFAVVGPLRWSFNRATGGMDPSTVLRLVVGESRRQKSQRREAELREREEQIQKAERELGIVS